jgi:hypothetical protein
MQALTEWTRRTMIMRDAEGRPLGEGKVGPEKRQDVQFELRRCPYPGSRHKHPLPMNISALRQITAHWNEVLRDVAHLRALHRQTAGTRPILLIDMWRIGNMVSTLVDFAFARTWSPYDDRQLPAGIAALYKAMLGVTSMTTALWSDGIIRFDSPIDAQMLYQSIEGRGQFIGADQVCSGPESMVRQLLSHVIGDLPPPPGPTTVSDVIGRPDRYLRLCGSTARYRLLRHAFRRMDGALRGGLVAALGEELQPDERHALTADSEEDPRLAAFLGRDAEQRSAFLDDLFAQIDDPRFAGPALGAGASLRAAWNAPLPPPGVAVAAMLPASARARALTRGANERLGRHLQRYIEIERIAAAAVAALKAQIADDLEVDLTSPEAAALRLQDFTPEAALPSMRTVAIQIFSVDLSALSH